MVFCRAAELKYGTLNDLQRKLEEAELAFGEQPGDSKGSRMLREEVTEDDIAEIIAKWTGIPVSKLRQSERYVSSFKAEIAEKDDGSDQSCCI